VTACAAAGINPLVAMDRQPHHPSLDERFAPIPPAPENPTPVEAVAHQLVTLAGKKLYALRKQTPEPVFGIIKSVLAFRHPATRSRSRPRRVEPGDHGLKHEAVVRAEPRAMRPGADRRGESSVSCRTRACAYSITSSAWTLALLTAGPASVGG
jgi:hypothetical protein